jgi:hypothetical protein
LTVEGEETYVDGNEDVQPVAFYVCVMVCVELLCGIMPHDHSILRELLVETFWRCAFDIEVKGLNWNEEAAERQEGKERTHFGQSAENAARGAIANGCPRILVFLQSATFKMPF